jgi:hypothetical protein
MSYRLKTVGGSRQVCAGFAVLMVIAAFAYSPAEAAPVAVRFPEGVTHGFLLVRSLAGEIIGQGEMTQVAKEGAPVESHLVFKFKDGSLHDEKVAFSQQQVFTLISYHLVQRGPSFPDQVDVAIDRGSGEYTVRSKAGEDGKDEVLTGAFDLPKDVYNGMVITIVLNLPKGTSETVHILAFTPEPEAIKLELHPMGEDAIRIGNLSRKALQYVFKPDIGMIRKWLARITGQLPAQFHYNCWVLADEVPGFVQYQGPLQIMGPIVQIELVSPGLVTKTEGEKSPSP